MNQLTGHGMGKWLLLLPLGFFFFFLLGKTEAPKSLSHRYRGLEQGQALGFQELRPHPAPDALPRSFLLGPHF